MFFVRLPLFALISSLALLSGTSWLPAAPVVSAQIADQSVYDATPALEIDLNTKFSDPTLPANTVRLTTVVSGSSMSPFTTSKLRSRSITFSTTSIPELTSQWIQISRSQRQSFSIARCQALSSRAAVMPRPRIPLILRSSYRDRSPPSARSRMKRDPICTTCGAQSQWRNCRTSPTARPANGSSICSITADLRTISTPLTAVSPSSELSPPQA